MIWKRGLRVVRGPEPVVGRNLPPGQPELGTGSTAKLVDISMPGHVAVAVAAAVVLLPLALGWWLGRR